MISLSRLQVEDRNVFTSGFGLFHPGMMPAAPSSTETRGSDLNGRHSGVRLCPSSDVSSRGGSARGEERLVQEPPDSISYRYPCFRALLRLPRQIFNARASLCGRPAYIACMSFRQVRWPARKGDEGRGKKEENRGIRSVIGFHGDHHQRAGWT